MNDCSLVGAKGWHYCGILICDICRILGREQRQKTTVVVVCKVRVIGPLRRNELGVAPSHQKSSNPLSRVWSHSILVDAVVEIYLDVGNPSICQSPFSEDRGRPAERAGRRLGSTWLSTSTHVTPHKHEAPSAAVRFASSTHWRPRNDPVHSIPFHAPQSTRITGRWRQHWRMWTSPVFPLPCRRCLCVIYHVSSCVTERICLVVPSVGVDDCYTVPSVWFRRLYDK